MSNIAKINGYDLIDRTARESAAAIADGGVSQFSNDAQYMTLGLGEAIQQGADLNGYTEPGVYQVIGWDDPSTSNNKPVGVPGVLVVYNSLSSTNYITQEYTVYDAANESSRGIKFLRNSSTAGTSWSKWTCIGGVDSIVADGSDNNWYYRKYANGTCEMVGSIFGLQTTSQSSGHYYKDWSVSYPFSVVSTPRVFCSATSASGLVFANPRVISTDSTTGRLSCLNEAAWCNVYLYVFGYWK